MLDEAFHVNPVQFKRMETVNCTKTSKVSDDFHVHPVVMLLKFLPFDLALDIPSLPTSAHCVQRIVSNN